MLHLRSCHTHAQQTLGLAWLLALGLWVTAAGQAWAHAHYSRSQPSIGQVLAAVPAQVDIFTDSDMRKLAGANVISITGPDGSQADDGNTIVDDADRQHFSVGLRPYLSNGRYIVTFKTLSDADGDTDGGKFAFYVGPGPTDAQKAQDASLNGPPVAVTAATAEPANSRRSALPLVIAAAALIVVLAVAAGGLVLRKRRAAPG
jgi:methionine-rich copper-binding protein CopC